MTTESMNDDQDSRTYRVVFNQEEQYSIWLAHKDVPPGWTDAGVVGPKGDCLAYISKIWTDMRPLSLRKTMASEKG